MAFIFFGIATPTPLPTIMVKCSDIGNCSSKTQDVSKIFPNIVSGLLLLIGMLAVIFVIVSAIQMSLSAGNAKRFQQARESLLYSLVGVGLAVAAFTVVQFIAGAFSS